jgi:O-antigen ligase
MTLLTGISASKNPKIHALFQANGLVFLALFAFPLYPMHAANALLMLFCALSLASYLVKPFPLSKILLRQLVFILPFLPYLIELIASGFAPIARFEFEKKLFFFTAVLFIPLFIHATGFKAYKHALLIFVGTVTGLMLYGISVLLAQGIPFNEAAYANGSFMLRHTFEQATGIHSTYFALFALASAAFLYARTGKWRLPSLITAGLLTAFTLYLAVRIAFVAFITLTLYAIITYPTHVRRKIVLVGVALIIMVGVAFLMPSLRNRLAEFSGFTPETIEHSNTISQRVAISTCSWNVFTENLLTGTGSRCFQCCLNKCYTSRNWPEGAAQNFNPHNQFLSFGVSYGIGGLLLFAVCLFIIFYRIRHVAEGRYFSLIILLFFLTESLLERSMGVYFFGLLGLMLYNMNTGFKNEIK